MSGSPGADIVIVSLGSTAGLRAADEELAASLRRAGASVAIARAVAPGRRRTMMLTDLAWARSARSACRPLLSSGKASVPRAVIYSSTTAALLWPRAGAIRFDATAAANRPGRHGLWQRPLERRRLDEATLLLPWSDGGLEEAGGVAHAGRTIVLPVPVEPSGVAREERDIAAVTYAANPSKKGLDRVLAAWRAVRRRRSGDDSELVVAGAGERELARAGIELAGLERVRFAGVLDPGEYRALLRRARVFVCAPRREDYGLAQLEALADGCRLVTTPAPGPYAALPIARALDGRLVSDDLAAALGTALEPGADDYASRARAMLRPFGRDAADRLVARELLPRLLG